MGNTGDTTIDAFAVEMGVPEARGSGEAWRRGRGSKRGGRRPMLTIGIFIPLSPPHYGDARGEAKVPSSLPPHESSAKGMYAKSILRSSHKLAHGTLVSEKVQPMQG